MKDSDIVVTGIGTISPYGMGTKLFWDGLRNGKNAIRDVKKMDLEKNYVHKGGEITWYNPEEYFSKRDLTRMDINSQYGILAVEEAQKNANIDKFPEMTGIFMGTLTAGLPFTEIYYENLLRNKHTPRYITQCFRSSLADNISKKYDITGPKITITTACSASAHAIAMGAQYLEKNKIDMAIVAGVDAFCKITWSGFSALRALSSTEIAPFSSTRNGTQIGEGGGCLILERYKSARERNAYIYATIEGWGASSDAHHITAPNPSGVTESLAMIKAIKKSGLSTEQIDVIAAHGTGTKLNDEMETHAIKNALGDCYKKPIVTSIKSMIGHTMGAAGIHLAIASIGMMKDGLVYPTINYRGVDDNCDLSIAANNAFEKNVKNVMINAFGFGGNNASVILKKVG